MIELIQNQQYGMYPKFQEEGFSAQYAFPAALKVCKGKGVDVGCNNESWKLPGAIAADPAMKTIWSAEKLPEDLDYIFSSHCLEHLPNWVSALNYWHSCLKPGGLVFLYLPHPKQAYWRSWNNKKHIHNLSPKLLRQYLNAGGIWTNVFVTGRDLNFSFYAVAEKAK